jgi:hypothetical protein
MKLCPSHKERTYAEDVREDVAEELFGVEMEEVTEERKKLCSEQLYNLYFSPPTTQLIKSRTGFVAPTEKKMNAYRFSWANLHKIKKQTRPRRRYNPSQIISLSACSGFIFILCDKELYNV